MDGVLFLNTLVEIFYDSRGVYRKISEHQSRYHHHYVLNSCSLLKIVNEFAQMLLNAIES